MNRRRLMKSGGINIDPVTRRGFVNGYEVVDLGLSNGLLFATCNVGATKETDYGDYYQWGAGDQYYDGYFNQYSTYAMYENDSHILPSEEDTATRVMGSEWRMPTRDEFQDLINKTNYEWIENFNGSGKNGGVFTSKTNPNAYVFFPAAGNYYDDSQDDEGNYGDIWSSSSYYKAAYELAFHSGYKYVETLERKYGLPVRGVTSVGGG